MKLVSIVVPCYNSEAYMEKCVNSLLIAGDEVEIIIVNDGSKDKTAEIANRYAVAYPDIVKVIHQENGGHGEAVNTGLKHATGIYFKVVDSDDWVSEDAYLKVIALIKSFKSNNQFVDMIITNYVYEKVGARHKRVIHYNDALPENRTFTWQEMKGLKKGQYLLMHAVIYKTAILKECKLQLPKHTFYVDNLFVYEPLPYVKTMYYLNVDFYRYFIGRDDQSVNEQVMIGRIDQQIKVNRIMVDYYNANKALIQTNQELSRYMFHYLEIITTVSSVLLIRSGEEENLEKKEELWNYIKEKDEEVYHELRSGIIGRVLHMHGRYGRTITMIAYKTARKLVGFS